jgi:hypothetical protein
MTGSAARIVWGYLPAARLSAWSLSADGTLTGMLADVDRFRLGQQGLTLRVDRPNGKVWAWPIITLSVADHTVSGTVSLQE